MIEAVTGTIELPDEKPEVFNIYAQWLYGSALPIQETTSDDEQSRKMLHLLVKPYLLGERLMDDAFLSAVENELLATYDAEPCSSKGWSDIKTIAYIYEHTPPNSRPRKIAIARGISWYKVRLEKFRTIAAKLESSSKPELISWYEDVLFELAGAGRDPRQLAHALLEKYPQSKERVTAKQALEGMQLRPKFTGMSTNGANV